MVRLVVEAAKREMDKRGWAPIHLAVASGLSVPTVHKALKGAGVSAETVFAFHAAFDQEVSILDLFSYAKRGTQPRNPVTLGVAG